MDLNAKIDSAVRGALTEGREIEYSIIRDAVFDCKHQRKTAKRRTYGNATKHYGYQCDDCGEWEQATKASFGLQLPVVEFDSEFRERTNKELNDAVAEYWRNYHEQKKDREKDEWWSWYRYYLESDKWKFKRLQVLQRDKYLCQGCLIERATEVHHLNYKHVGDELLFDLVSLCSNCHKKAHDKDGTAT